MISDASCDTEDCENKLKGHHRNELHLKMQYTYFNCNNISQTTVFYQIN